MEKRAALVFFSNCTIIRDNAAFGSWFKTQSCCLLALIFLLFTVHGPGVSVPKSVCVSQAQLGEMEQTQSQGLTEVSRRLQQDMQQETERLRGAQLQAERTLEARERAHRQRVKGLEEQVSTLKEQLQQELRRRQPHFSHSSILSGN